MRRLRASIPTLLSILLLGLCIAAAVINRQRTLRWGFSTLHNRYTFLIDHQRFLIRASPPPRKEDAEAWILLKRLRNEDVQWIAEWIADVKDPLVMPSFKQDSPAYRLNSLYSASDEPFLRGLDSRNKFIAAHALLTYRERRRFQNWILLFPDHKSFAEGVSGMRFDLRMEPPPLTQGHFVMDPISSAEMNIDLDQLPVLRDMWHDILDRTILSFSIWWIASAAMMVFALKCAGAIRRLKRLRSGHCVHCGYDLRASVGVCPECGLAINNPSSTPSAAT